MSKRRRYEGAVAPVNEAGVSPEPQAEPRVVEPRVEDEHSVRVDDRSAGCGVDSVRYSYPIEVDGVGVILPGDQF
jgi:hypothetical protein